MSNASGNAEVLNNRFCSVFAQEAMHNIPRLKKGIIPAMHDAKVDVLGI